MQRHETRSHRIKVRKKRVRTVLRKKIVFWVVQAIISLLARKVFELVWNLVIHVIVSNFQYTGDDNAYSGKQSAL